MSRMRFISLNVGPMGMAELRPLLAQGDCVLAWQLGSAERNTVSYTAPAFVTSCKQVKNKTAGVNWISVSSQMFFVPFTLLSLSR